MGRRWDPAHDKELIRIYREECEVCDSLTEAKEMTALRIDRTESAVASRLSQLRVLGEPGITYDGTGRYRAVRDGMTVATGTYRDLSDATGLAVSTLRYYRWLTKNGSPLWLSVYLEGEGKDEV